MIMKLILCTACHDVFKCNIGEVRSCKCGKATGRYLNKIDAEYAGETAVPIGFGNTTLSQAIQNQPERGMGMEFEAFVIPKECDTFIKKDSLHS